MKYNLYTVRDMKADAYLRVFQARTDGEAIRMFTESVNDPSSMFNTNPEDFILFNCGIFDDNTGEIEVAGVLSVAKAIDLIKISHEVNENG